MGVQTPLPSRGWKSRSSSGARASRIIMKVVERVIHQQLYRYLSHDHIVSTTQRGFHARHSTETALSLTDTTFLPPPIGAKSQCGGGQLSANVSVLLIMDSLPQICKCTVGSGSAHACRVTRRSRPCSMAPGSRRRLGHSQTPECLSGLSAGTLLFSVFLNDLSLCAGDAVVFQYAMTPRYW